MVARADQSAVTRRRIVDAAISILFGSLAPLTLNEAAARAGVSVQTVVRVFGGRDNLVEAAATDAWRRVVDHRSSAPVGDVAAAVKVLFIHYEAYGDRLIQARAREGVTPELVPGLVRARADHRRWVARTFRPQLNALDDPERGSVISALVAATDVYTWKVLRRDLELARREAEATLTRMVAAVSGSAAAEPTSG